MDQPLDFSFHKGNPFVLPEDESPKPMPSPPALQVNSENLSTQGVKVTSSADVTNAIETLAISSPSNVQIASSNSSTTLTSSSTKLDTTKAFQQLPEDQVSSLRARPRTKIPFEKGFTQMDWLKLTRTESDLAGLNGSTNRRLISLSEVKQHKQEDDAWTVLRGQVYNISRYLKFHPGGVDMLMKGAGTDCTNLFNTYHRWVNAEYLLEKCLVGFLDTTEQH